MTDDDLPQELWNTNRPQEGAHHEPLWDISTSPEDPHCPASPGRTLAWKVGAEVHLLEFLFVFLAKRVAKVSRVSLFMSSWLSSPTQGPSNAFSRALIQAPARHTEQNKTPLIRDNYSKSAARAQPCSRSCAKWVVNKQICSLSAEGGIKIRFNFSTNPGIWHCQNNFLFENNSRLWVRQQKRTGREI